LSRLREAAHLKAVLDNLQFQLDPFAAIHQHLLATQLPAGAKDDAMRQGKDSKKKKRRKAYTIFQLLEIHL